MHYYPHYVEVNEVTIAFFAFYFILFYFVSIVSIACLGSWQNRHPLLRPVQHWHGSSVDRLLSYPPLDTRPTVLVSSKRAVREGRDRVFPPYSGAAFTGIRKMLLFCFFIFFFRSRDTRNYNLKKITRYCASCILWCW